jgi:hypothetical protein
MAPGSWQGAAIVGTALLVMCGSAPVSAEVVGRTAVVVQRVTGTLEQNVRQLALRDEVSQNELLATGPESASEILFLDGTTVALGSDAKLLLDEFAYDPRPSRAKMSVRVVEGAFRFITGAFSHNAYTVSTPTMTIGVRGTSFGCWVKPSGDDDVSMTFCRVTEGAIAVTNKETGQTTLVGPGGTIEARSTAGSGSSTPPGSEPGPDQFPRLSLAALGQLDSLLQGARMAGLAVPPSTLLPPRPEISNPPYSGLGYAQRGGNAGTGGSILVGPRGIAPVQLPGPVGPVVQTLEASSAAVASPSGFQ